MIQFLLSSDFHYFRRPAGNVRAEPKNVAIPSRSFIQECETGQLNITLYVQFNDGFLSMENLSNAIEVFTSLST